MVFVSASLIAFDDERERGNTRRNPWDEVAEKVPENPQLYVALRGVIRELRPFEDATRDEVNRVVKE